MTLYDVLESSEFMKGWLLLIFVAVACRKLWLRKEKVGLVVAWMVELHLSLSGE